MSKRKPAAGRRDFMRILGYLRPHLPVFGVGLLCSALFGASEAAAPWLMYLLLDADEVSGWVTPEQLVYVLPAAILVVFFARGLFGFGRTYIQHWLEHTMVADIRRALVAKIIHLPQSYHDQETSGVLISRVLLYASRMSNMSTLLLITLTTDLMRFVALITTMLIIDWQLTAIILLALPVTLLSIRYFSRKIRHHSTSLAKTEGDFTAQLADSIQGQQIVKAFGGRERETQLLDEKIGRLRGFGIRLGAALALNRPAAQMVLALGIAVVLGLLARALAIGEITEGQLGAFLFATGMLPLSIRGLSSIPEFYQQALVAADRVFGVIDNIAEADDGNLVPAQITGALEFSGVSFSYPRGNRPAVDQISFSIAPGERIALVGATGSGKSTLTHLLLRLYQPDGGQISLDGRSIAQYRLESLRRAIGLVTQEVLLFDASVAENVAYPARGANIDRARLDKALAAANIDDAVARLADGADTLIGERGTRLSGGERQRLSIARAFYKDAPILILDEATSALDSITEEKIRSAIDNLLRNRTALIIAHRFATVRSVDRIVMLEQGRIATIGTHAELMEKSVSYRTMYQAQQLPDAG
ncbi:MAG: ABC transporter transmembrane domain-containing protein [Betaproteobacteria bacterium]|nr:ABC transporter transmembrane domain-containing protein [Betaproteobacteria bacterium]